MGKNYKLRQTGAEVQAILDKVVGIYSGTTEYWNSQVGYIPDAGELIIYTDYKSVDGKDVPGIKVGSGNGYVQDLAFASEADSKALFEHINNMNIHVSAAEKELWNRKLNVTDNQEVVEETLIFNRN